MSLLSTMNISTQGLDAAGKRLQAHAANIANASTPYYVRKIPVVSETNEVTFQGILADMRNNVYHTGLAMSNGGVAYNGNVSDPTPGKRMYAPGHPQADEHGYITMSNVNIISDMADSMVASKLYEANLSVLGIIKQMANRAMEIGRGQ